jgi:hypothetical protein
MPANTTPIFSKIGKINWSSSAISAANTAKDGTGTVTTVFTADATNGSFVERVVFQPIGTNIQTVARIFINNGSSNGTPANNVYYKDITLAASTLSETASMAQTEVTLNIALPAGYKLNVVLGTAVSAGYMATAVGGDY